jgi:(p)ppGpp synthase/HD superfamily hydrolase
VAARVEADEARAVAWLHDVVEDTAVTLDDLAAQFPAEVVQAVRVLTRRDDDRGEEYYRRVRANPLALAVKLADIADNTDPARQADLDPATRRRLAAKYRHARAVLTGDPHQ